MLYIMLINLGIYLNKKNCCKNNGLLKFESLTEISNNE